MFWLPKIKVVRKFFAKSVGGLFSLLTPELSIIRVRKMGSGVTGRSLISPVTPMRELELEDIDLAFFRAYEKHKEEVKELLHLIGAKTPKRALQKLKSERDERASQAYSEKERITELCNIVSTSDFSSLKKRVIALAAADAKAKRETISARYGFDMSNYTRNGERWSRELPKGKNTTEMIDRFNKQSLKQQDILKEVHNGFLLQVYLKGMGESYAPEKVQELCESWHWSMVEDYDLLTFEEFWQKYYGSQYDIDILPSEPQSVLLYDALPLVKKYAPVRIYQEIWDADPERYGYVTRHKYNQWEAAKTSADNLQEKERRREMYNLTVQILGLAAFRGMEGPDETFTNPVQESSLMLLLGHEEINPYRRDFVVDDQTSFMEFHTNYLTAIGGHDNG